MKFRPLSWLLYLLRKLAIGTVLLAGIPAAAQAPEVCVQPVRGQKTLLMAASESSTLNTNLNQMLGDRLADRLAHLNVGLNHLLQVVGKAENLELKASCQSSPTAPGACQRLHLGRLVNLSLQANVIGELYLKTSVIEKDSGEFWRPITQICSDGGSVRLIARPNDTGAGPYTLEIHISDLSNVAGKSFSTETPSDALAIGAD